MSACRVLIGICNNQPVTPAAPGLNDTLASLRQPLCTIADRHCSKGCPYVMCVGEVGGASAAGQVSKPQQRMGRRCRALTCTGKTGQG